MAHHRRTEMESAATALDSRPSRIHHLALCLGLSCMVLLNLTLMVWLLAQLNLPVTAPSSSSFHLIGKILLDGQLYLSQLAPTRDELRLRSPVPGISVLPGAEHEHHLSTTGIRILPNRIEANVPGFFTIRSALDDRLLMLRTPTGSQRTFVEHVELRSNRVLSLRNGAIQVSRVNGTQIRISAATNRIRMRGTRRLQISASNGFVRIAGRQAGIVMRSGRGAIRWNATRVRLEPGSVRTVVGTNHGRTYLTVGQVCLCRRTGRLFAAAPTERCSDAGRGRCE